MKIPGEAKGSWSTRETTQANIRDPPLLHAYFFFLKKRYKEGDGWGMYVKKSSSTKCKRKGEQLKRKKRTHETVFLLISSTHQMANIILDDGHFAKESEKAGGR